MQTRRQDCRISSKPLVICVPKYGFVQIREGSLGGRLPFPDLRAHDPLRACRRLPMPFCRGTFRCQVLAGTTSATCRCRCTWRTGRTARPGLRVSSGANLRDRVQISWRNSPGARSLPYEFRPVLRRAVGYHQDLACGLQLDKLLPGKGAVSKIQRDRPNTVKTYDRRYSTTLV